jgi:hypothetical protein
MKRNEKGFGGGGRGENGAVSTEGGAREEGRGDKEQKKGKQKAYPFLFFFFLEGRKNKRNSHTIEKHH